MKSTIQISEKQTNKQKHIVFICICTYVYVHKTLHNKFIYGRVPEINMNYRGAGNKGTQFSKLQVMSLSLLYGFLCEQGIDPS